MKRDMELVRKMLLDFSRGEAQKNFNTDNEADQLYMYHLEMLKEAGFINFEEKKFKGGMFLLEAPTLTWGGNDYLDSVADEKIWNKTKAALKSKGIELSSIPFSLLKDLAVIQGRQLLGLE